MKIKLKIETIFKTDENEDIVIINFLKEDKSYFKVSGVAKEIFEKIKNDSSYDEIIDDLLAKYNISKEQAKADLDDFILNLEKHELIEKD
jgi:hypothetical protein